MERGRRSVCFLDFTGKPPRPCLNVSAPSQLEPCYINTVTLTSKFGISRTCTESSSYIRNLITGVKVMYVLRKLSDLLAAIEIIGPPNLHRFKEASQNLTWGSMIGLAPGQI
jgi:hypothetical protein